MCHTELNFPGVPRRRYYLAGAFVQDYYAPNINSQGLQYLPLNTVINIFLHETKPTGGSLLGPMRDVEHNSLRYLREEHMRAIADYRKVAKSESPPVEGLQVPLKRDAGRRLYERSCAACHATGIAGAPQVNRQKIRRILRDQACDHLYQIAIKGDGPMPPKGGCNICSDARVEAAVNYMIGPEPGCNSHPH